jgi:hypothetical protein
MEECLRENLRLSFVFLAVYTAFALWVCLFLLLT